MSNHTIDEITKALECTGSVRLAAKELGCTPSVLHKEVKALYRHYPRGGKRGQQEKPEWPELGEGEYSVLASTKGGKGRKQYRRRGQPMKEASTSDKIDEESGEAVGWGGWLASWVW